jgi:hypothetical protein
MADAQDYPVNAVHVIRTAQQINVQLSAMADQKASILMGAAFVIFTIAINQARSATPPLPLLILGATAFTAAIFAVLAIMPALGGGRPRGPANLLFFGAYAHLSEEEFTEAMLATIRSDEAGFRAMLRDMHQNGIVLARKKYRMLAYAYRAFLLGMTASLAAFVAERLAI